MLFRRRFLVFPLVSVIAATPWLGAQVSQPASNPARTVPGSGNVPMISITTPSEAAREHFLAGIRAQDEELPIAARDHFAAAIAADSSFALAHLFAATNAASFALYKAHLEKAVRHGAKASSAERLLIAAEQSASLNDLNARLRNAQQLVNETSRNPWALRALARAQLALGRTAEARATFAQILQTAPDFAAVHAELGNSYLQSTPRDPTRAESHLRRALELAPDAMYTHDCMGDFYRATNQLQKAKSEYTRASELVAGLAGPFQQRAHVNAFLGNYAEARADYDRAIALAEPNVKAGFGIFRALLGVYAGDPAAAERELDSLVLAIDPTTVPNAVGIKINALTDQALIATHHGHFDVAKKAIERLGPLWQTQAQVAGTPAIQGLAKAAVAYAEGMLAARQGNYALARAKAKEYMSARAGENNPRKDEGAHAILGMADLREGKHASAVGHFEKTDQDDIYMSYHRALALAGAGRRAEARAIFKQISEWNFSSAGLALVQRDAANKLK